MALSPNDVYRLVHHYLLKEGFEASADTFANECSHLAHFCTVTRSDGTRELPRLIGPSLSEIIDEYFYVKDFIIDELQQHVCCSHYRSHDSLLTLFRTLTSHMPIESCHLDKPISSRSTLSQHSGFTNIRCEAQHCPAQTNDSYIGPEGSSPTENDGQTNDEMFVPEINNVCSLQECLEENCDSLPAPSPSHCSENYQESSPETEEKPCRDHLFLVSMSEGYLVLEPALHSGDNPAGIHEHLEILGAEDSLNQNHGNMVDEEKGSSHKKDANNCNAARRKSKKVDEKERLIREIMLMAKVTSKVKHLRSDRRSKDSRRRSGGNSELEDHHSHRKRRKIHQNRTPSSDGDDENTTIDSQRLFEAFPPSENVQPPFDTILRIKEEPCSEEVTADTEYSRIPMQIANMSEDVNQPNSAILRERLPAISSADYQISESCALPCLMHVKQENADDFGAANQETSQPVVVLSNVLRNLPILH